MKNVIFIIIVVVLTCSVTEVSAQVQQQNKFEFRDVSIQIPMSKEQAVKEFNLDEFMHSGNIDSRHILAHINSEGDVVGLTIYYRIYEETSAELSLQLENGIDEINHDLKNLFGKELVKLEMANPFFIDPAFHYMEIEDNQTIVTGTVFYNLMYNTYSTVSYFKDVELEEVKNYLRYLY